MKTIIKLLTLSVFSFAALTSSAFAKHHKGHHETNHKSAEKESAPKDTSSEGSSTNSAQ